MPCLAIHLAVVKRYLEKNSGEDCDKFIEGSFAPDLGYEDLSSIINGINENSKNARHFGSNNQINSGLTFYEYMKKKVDLNKFLLNNKIDNSFEKGYFLHLLCDYYFFDYFLNSDLLTNYSFEEGIKIGHNDYNLITPILIKKYNLDVPEKIKNLILNPGFGELKFVTEDITDRFIEDMSDIDFTNKSNEFMS